MGDNGDLKTQKEILSGAEKPILETGGNGEIKPQGQTPDLGKAETPNLGQAGNLSKEEVKKEAPPTPPTEFKICEIWLRQGKIFIDAQEEFWKDKCRALGLLEYCKDIVKEARNMPEAKIVPAKGGVMNFARKLGNKFRRG